MKKLIFILITVLMLAGCAVADAEPSAPVEQPEVVEVVEPELTEADIETLKESCVMIYADNGETQVQGSGVAISENRYLTAYHVIADGRTNLKTSDGEKLTIEGYDRWIDVMTLTSSRRDTLFPTGTLVSRPALSSFLSSKSAHSDPEDIASPKLCVYIVLRKAGES